MFQRVDADYVSVCDTRTSLTGTGGKLEAGKVSDGHWRYKASVTWRSPELELNDIGFLRQADEIKQTLYVSYQSLKPFGILEAEWFVLSHLLLMILEVFTIERIMIF